MIAHRVGLAALQRAAAKSNISLTQTAPKLASTAGIFTTAIRHAKIEKLSVDEGNKLLANQRLQRPVSPHLGIYKLEQTWVSASAWNRITGCILSSTLYVYMSTYVIAPVFGVHIESASIIPAFSSMPFIAQSGFKFILGFPFAYHLMSGIKHLTYDLGLGYTKSTILKSEKTLWAASILGSLLLVFAL